MEERTYPHRVLDYLKGGDLGKVKRFTKKVIAWNSGQIKERQTLISDLNEKIEDLEEEMAESTLAVDLGSIHTGEAAKSYVEPFTRKLLQFSLDIKVTKDSIATLEREIVAFESIIDKLK